MKYKLGDRVIFTDDILNYEGVIMQLDTMCRNDLRYQVVVTSGADDYGSSIAWLKESEIQGLVSDKTPTSETKAKLNFWEAREAALNGKKVKRIVTQVVYTPSQMLHPETPWYNVHFDGDWEIVEEPKHKTCYINVYLHNMCPWGAHETRALADSHACTDRVSCLAVTVDENGKLVEAKNV